MIVLDENFIEDERERLRAWHIPARHIGYDIGRKGIGDEEIIPFLQTLTRPTFFSEDAHFFRKRLCHAKYCIVQLDVKTTQMARYARQFLHHPEFDTHAKRMGTVIRVSPTGLAVWRVHRTTPEKFSWKVD